MKKIFILSITMLLSVLALSACTSGAAPSNTVPAVSETPLIKPAGHTSVSAAPVSTEPSETPAPSIKDAPMQRVYGKDDTNIIEGAGQTFVIQLDENPTTGYQWADAVISDDSIVKQTESSYEAMPVASGIVGSGGTRTITFKALKAGKATITLNYQRSWEKKPAETLVYNITVN